MSTPYLSHLSKRWHYLHKSVKYNDSGQVLDVWRTKDAPDRAPVLIWIPGGAWISGSRFTMQGHALLSQLVDQGWICLSIDYRTAPLHRWPDPINDVRSALSWARAHVVELGGNPDFIVVAGASAGGHLALLTGLTDQVSATVSLYGSYDWQSQRTWWRKVFMEYVQDVVVGKRLSHSPNLFEAASPMAQIHADAPPMMIVHGARDRIISVKEARRFYDKMFQTSRSRVHYLEVPAGHAFDLMDSVHAPKAVWEICQFLEDTYLTSSNNSIIQQA